MKKVEMTDSGLIISCRNFFNEKYIFVPFEDIASVKHRFRWIYGNFVTIEFTELTEFGDKISFQSKGYQWIPFSTPEIVGELNAKAAQSKNATPISAASLNFD